MSESTSPTRPTAGDLARARAIGAAYAHRSDERGQMAGAIQALGAEVERKDAAIREVLQIMHDINGTFEDMEKILRAALTEEASDA